MLDAKPMDSNAHERSTPDLRPTTSDLRPIVPRIPFTIRPGTMDDLPFIDALQKKHSKAVGFFPRKALEGKINAGHVLVAVGSLELGVGREDRAPSLSYLHTPHSTLPTPLGYLIGNDQYYKRDDLGCIFQMNVIPEARRSLVAASLLKAQFERSAYGCRLYCCWCAQDLEANRFWEAMGFQAIAYRTGSDKATKRRSDEGKPSVASSLCRSVASGRIHLFWQKRIRQGDTTTPWWFPSKTTGGALAAERIVLPLPIGASWEADLPQLLPPTEAPALPAGRASTRGTKENRAKKVATSRRSMFGSPERTFAPPEPCEMKVEPVERPKRAKPKHDPKLIAAARELRDRALEQINTMEAPPSLGKYEVARVAVKDCRTPLLGSAVIGRAA